LGNKKGGLFGRRFSTLYIYIYFSNLGGVNRKGFRKYIACI